MSGANPSIWTGGTPALTRGYGPSGQPPCGGRRNSKNVNRKRPNGAQQLWSPEGTEWGCTLGIPLEADDGANGYELTAQEFMVRRSESHIGVVEVRRWAKRLPPGAAVLDLGCGHGVPLSKALMEERCAVWGIDASPTLVAAFRTRFPGARVECARVEDSDLFGRTFGGVMAWGLLFLLEQGTQAHLLGKISSALEPAGKLLFTAPEQSHEWVDLLTGRKSVSLGAEAYRRILDEAGMDLIEQLQDEGDNHYYLAAKR